VRGWRVGTGGREEMTGKGVRKLNTVQIMYTHVCKCKNDTLPVEIVPGIGGGKVKESSERGEIKYI
jgi:precorrin-2 methylase